MGHLNKKWSAAVALYLNVPNDSSFNMSWTSQVIIFFWKYTGSSLILFLFSLNKHDKNPDTSGQGSVMMHLVGN